MGTFTLTDQEEKTIVAAPAGVNGAVVTYRIHNAGPGLGRIKVTATGVAPVELGPADSLDVVVHPGGEMVIKVKNKEQVQLSFGWYEKV